MNERSGRAKLFMPFNSLKGFYDMILEQKCEKCPRRELSEDDAAALSDMLNEIEKGDVVTVRYYLDDHYEELTGIISENDRVFRRLTVVRTRVPFDDISELNRNV